MNPTHVVRATASGRTPLIHFLGKRTIPEAIDHTPRAHPAAPTQQLPTSFAEYRKNAQQHGPLSGYNKSAGRNSAIEPKAGEVFDRNQLPQRFWRTSLSKEEIEVIESGGAAAFA